LVFPLPQGERVPPHGRVKGVYSLNSRKRRYIISPSFNCGLNRPDLLRQGKVGGTRANGRRKTCLTRIGQVGLFARIDTICPLGTGLGHSIALSTRGSGPIPREKQTPYNHCSGGEAPNVFVFGFMASQQIGIVHPARVSFPLAPRHRNPRAELCSSDFGGELLSTETHTVPVPLSASAFRRPCASPPEQIA